MTLATVAAPAKAEPLTRIIGIDVARAIAMLAMLIVHYIWPDESGSILDTTARSLSGRAMPLFMLLGGIGVTLASRRSTSRTRDLLVRALILTALGLVLHETSVWVAVVLQSYGLFFAVAPLFRGLSSRALLAASAAIATIGAFTYRTVGTPSQPTSFADLLTPHDAVQSLLFDGYYPFFPVASFFVLGLWLGRLDLRSSRLATLLAVVGAVAAVTSVRLASALVTWFGIDTTAFGTNRGPFAWGRLLDSEGHSQMPAWVLSAGGSSVAVLGLSLLIAGRLGSLARPMVAVGALPLTFYAFQIVLTQVVSDPRSTSFGQELVTVAAIYGGFLVFATWWRSRFGPGPLEALLRVGSKRSSAQADS